MSLLVDSHCHLDFPELEADRAAILDRARAAGVALMVTISTRVRQFDRIRAVAEADPRIFCSVGTHPHNAAEEPDVTVDELVALAEHPKVVAIAPNRPRASAGTSPRRGSPGCRW
jgi:TatD DNase family protein